MRPRIAGKICDDKINLKNRLALNSRLPAGKQPLDGVFRIVAEVAREYDAIYVKGRPYG